MWTIVQIDENTSPEILDFIVTLRLTADSPIHIDVRGGHTQVGEKVSGFLEAMEGKVKSLSFTGATPALQKLLKVGGPGLRRSLEEIELVLEDEEIDFSPWTPFDKGVPNLRRLDIWSLQGRFLQCALPVPWTSKLLLRDVGSMTNLTIESPGATPRHIADLLGFLRQAQGLERLHLHLPLFGQWRNPPTFSDYDNHLNSSSGLVTLPKLQYLHLESVHFTPFEAVANAIRMTPEKVEGIALLCGPYLSLNGLSTEEVVAMEKLYNSNFLGAGEHLLGWREGDGDVLEVFEIGEHGSAAWKNAFLIRLSKASSQLLHFSANGTFELRNMPRGSETHRQPQPPWLLTSTGTMFPFHDNYPTTPGYLPWSLSGNIRCLVLTVPYSYWTIPNGFWGVLGALQGLEVVRVESVHMMVIGAFLGSLHDVGKDSNDTKAANASGAPPPFGLKE